MGTDEQIVQEIAGRRLHVLQKFADFEQKAVEKRRYLVQSGQFQRFLRSAAEFKQDTELLIETAENVEILHNTEHLNRISKIWSRLRSEADGKRHFLPSIENETARLLADGHYAKEEIQKTLLEVRNRWNYLLELLNSKWLQIQKEQESLDFSRKCSILVDWMDLKKSENKSPKIFDEIRKFSILWSEISAIFQNSQPSEIDTETFERTREKWAEFQKFLEDRLKELDENERMERFVENSKELMDWMIGKETEIGEKYSKMDVEESMKYRKTIEIEIKSVQQRMEDVRKEGVEIGEGVDGIEKRFEQFQKFIRKWRFDVENAADLDSLLRESEDIRFWCSEKLEDLKIMETSENGDSDEISMWIETNLFDFNSWDRVVEQFENSAERLLEKTNDSKLRDEVSEIRELYQSTKEKSMSCNVILEERIKRIDVERLIFQTHQKSAHLVNVLEKNGQNAENMETEDIEKELRMIDGVAVRCSSVVDQIEHIQMELKDQIGKLSEKSRDQLDQLAKMKEILKDSSKLRRELLEKLLDSAYFLDSCVEIKNHTETIYHQLKENRIRKEAILPIREQIEALKAEIPKFDDESRIRIGISHLKKAEDVVGLIEKELETLNEKMEKRRKTERIEKFVERVEKWIEENGREEDVTETDSTTSLRRELQKNQNIVSISKSYQKTIQEKREESENEEESQFLLDGIQKALENLDEEIQKTLELTRRKLEEKELMNELNSQNDWIKMKIRELSVEPIWDSINLAQKMTRRYEKDDEEIENRRRLINEVLLKKSTSSSEGRHPILEEIEQNWNQMKGMFDERGGVLERMIRLFEYEEEAVTTSEWLREKTMYADAIEPKEDESINRVMVKKLEALADDVENYKPKIVETHALLEDALVTPKTKDSTSQQVIKFKNALTRKQGEIESDYVALSRLIEKKVKELRTLLQDGDVIREISELERWIEEEETILNRFLSTDSEELPTKLDDVTMNLQRRRANLTDIKCHTMAQGGGQLQMQKIDDAFGMLDVFSFELDRIRQRADRANILKSMTSEVNDVSDAIQTMCEKIDYFPSFSKKTSKKMENWLLPNLDGDLETLRRRVISSLDKAKEVRAANADLAPQVYDLEEKLEKEWTEVSKSAENRKKKMEKAKMVADLEAELIDMEQWIDTFNEEVIVVTGGIHDGLGVQVGLESIDTWREELSHRVDQLGEIKNLLASVISSISSQEERNEWLGRVSDVESDLLKARKTIDGKQDELSELSNILGAERDCDRLNSWIQAKREVLESESTTNNAKTLIRKMNEVEKMMMGRGGEVEELRAFVDGLKEEGKNSKNFKASELEEKLEKLEDEWRYLEEELKRKETGLNESMSQLLVDEQYEKVQQWIDEKLDHLKQLEDSNSKNKNLENHQKSMEKLNSQINEFLPIYQDLVENPMVDEEKLTVIREMWSTMIETTTIRQKTLATEIQKNRLFDLLEDIDLWLNDAEAEVHSAINFSSFYGTVDAEKTSRRLKSINEQAGEKDDLLRRVRRDESIDATVDKLREGLAELKTLIKTNSEDLEVWKSMQEVVKAMDDEICWYKEISVIVSSTDVGHDSPSLQVIRRKHQRIQLESERRKQKVAKIIDRTTELMSGKNRPSLDSKIDEIDEKVEQLTQLLESNQQIADIRTNRLEKWAQYFELMDEIREKEHVIEGISELRNGSPEVLLIDVERKLEILETIGDQMDSLQKTAVEMTKDEVIRTKTAENSVEKLRNDWKSAVESMENVHFQLRNQIDVSKFVWKCDTAIQCIKDQEEKIASLIRQSNPTSNNFENATYQSTMTFVEMYSEETISKLIETAKKLTSSGSSSNSEEVETKVTMVMEKLDSLKEKLELLAEKIGDDGQRKLRIQTIQEDYSKRACELANWLEQADEDVAGIVFFQTKTSSEECRQTLLQILDLLRNEKVELLGELELLEVELAELNEDVNTFTWYSHRTLSNRMERLDQTISDRIRIVDSEIGRHLENEEICEKAASILQQCRNLISETRKELEEVHSLKLDDQKEVLIELIDRLQGNGMIGKLEEMRSLMGSRYIFDNKFTNLTPHAVLVDTCHCLELMSSMLRSVETSIGERNSSGVTEKQIREFELAFDYFDREKNGWLDYEHFELCIKSQGYDFTIETASAETMQFLDPKKSGRILKTDYMRWMVKNETTNILDDHSAIEDALKTLDATKISDSMSRKEAEFFMRKMAKHTETVTTEHVRLEYKDFVNSFY